MANQPTFLTPLPSLLRREVEEGRAAVVGGAIRSHFDHTQLNDIDVYVFSKEDYDRIVRELNGRPVDGTDGLVHIVPDSLVEIEVIFAAACGSAEQCVANADFDIAGGTYCAGEFHLPEGFLEATSNKVMHFCHTHDPQRAYWRYIKYNREYGYRIDSSIQTLLSLWQERSSK